MFKATLNGSAYSATRTSERTAAACIEDEDISEETYGEFYEDYLEEVGK